MSTSYSSYLESEHWKQPRRQALERERYRCQKCGSRYLLQVHHTKYGKLNKVASDSLVVLCRYHHEKEHGISSGIRPIRPDIRVLLKGVKNVPVRSAKAGFQRASMTPKQIRAQIEKNKSEGDGATMRLEKERMAWRKP